MSGLLVGLFLAIGHLLMFDRNISRPFGNSIRNTSLKILHPSLGLKICPNLFNYLGLLVEISRIF